MDSNHALIIGIASYPSINKLPRSVTNDAYDIYDIFTDPTKGGYFRNNVQLLTDSQASKINICEGLKTLSLKCSEKDSAFIYFSAHAGKITSGPFMGHFLLPVDTDFSSVQALVESAISSNSLADFIKTIPARRVVVILIVATPVVLIPLGILLLLFLRQVYQRNIMINYWQVEVG